MSNREKQKGTKEEEEEIKQEEYQLKQSSTTTNHHQQEINWRDKAIYRNWRLETRGTRRLFMSHHPQKNNSWNGDLIICQNTQQLGMKISSSYIYNKQQVCFEKNCTYLIN